MSRCVKVREVIIFLSSERFKLILDGFKKGKFEDTHNMPFLECTFEITDCRLLGHGIKIIQNNIKYGIYRMNEESFNCGFKGYKANMIYVDKDLKISDDIINKVLSPMLIINSLKGIWNTNQFISNTHRGYIKFI